MTKLSYQGLGPTLFPNRPWFYGRDALATVGNLLSAFAFSSTNLIGAGPGIHLTHTDEERKTWSWREGGILRFEGADLF